MPSTDISFLRGDKSDLNSVTKEDGQFIVAMNDDQKKVSLYADVKNDSNVVVRMPLDNDASEELLKTTVGWTRRNLLENKCVSEIIDVDGVRFFIDKNQDGSVTLDGTLSEGTPTEIIINSDLTIPFNGYRLSGCPAGGGATTYELQYLDEDGTEVFSDRGSGVLINFQNVGYSKYTCQIKLHYDSSDPATFDNLTFYPMISDPNASDQSYEPYYPTLIKDDFDAKVDYSYLDKVGAKNLLEITEDSETVQDVVFTVNSDGSITANGTATNNSMFYMKRDFTFKAGVEYILSGLPSGLPDNTWLAVFHVGLGTHDFKDTGNGVHILYNTDTRREIVWYVKNGVTLDNVTAYPMIRYASNSDDTYQPYVPTNKQLSIDKVGWEDNNVLGAKNLIDYYNPPYKSDGITITKSGENITASISSTFTTVTYPNIAYGLGNVYNNFFEPGDYILSLGVVSVTGDEVKIGTSDEEGFAHQAERLNISTPGYKVFKISPSYKFQIRLWLRFGSNNKDASITYLNLMLRPANISDDTYIPFADTNRNLTISKANISAIGTDETRNENASTNYSEGAYFYKNGKIGRAKSSIASGAAFTLNTNYEELPLANLLEKTLLVKRELTSSDDLNNITVCGIYSIVSTSTPSHLPLSSAMTASLFVFPIGGTVAQVIFYPFDGKIFMRRQSNYAWNNWYQFSGTALTT